MGVINELGFSQLAKKLKLAIGQVVFFRLDQFLIGRRTNNLISFTTRPASPLAGTLFNWQTTPIGALDEWEWWRRILTRESKRTREKERKREGEGRRKRKLLFHLFHFPPFFTICLSEFQTDLAPCHRYRSTDYRAALETSWCDCCCCSIRDAFGCTHSNADSWMGLESTVVIEAKVNGRLIFIFEK